MLVKIRACVKHLLQARVEGGAGCHGNYLHGSCAMMAQEAVLSLESSVPVISGSQVSGGEAIRRLFVAALTEQSSAAWRSLFHHLSKIPASDCQALARQPDIQHYIARTLQHAEQHAATHSHRIVESLASLFPHEVEKCQREGFSVSYNHTEDDDSKQMERRKGRRRRRRERGVSLDSGLARLFTFCPDQVPVTFRGQDLQLSDLTRAAKAVAHDFSLQKKTALYLPPAVHHPPHPPLTLPQPSLDAHKPTLSPVYRCEAEPRGEAQATSTSSASQLNTPRKRVHFEKKAKAKKQVSSEPKLRTAHDVIAAFATGSLQAGAESVYLNYAPCTPWNPYNLMVVTKTRADPEHFIISKFGILHVHPDGRSDLQSFADWLWEEGLFSLCRQVPFFRQYLLRKSLRHWHRNVCYSHFVRLHAHVRKVALQFFPDFQEGLQKVHSLNTELLGIPTHTLGPNGNHSPEMFEKSVAATEVKVHRLLQRYFKYCQRVVSEVIEKTCSRAQELEEEKRHQPFVSDLPISVQTEKHATLDRSLSVARYRVSRLGDFVKLVEQMVSSCLLSVARQAAQEWVEHTLGLREVERRASLDTPDERDIPTPEEGLREVESSSAISVEGGAQALLNVELRTGDGGTLMLYPPEDELVAMLTTPLHTITTLIISTTTPLTGHIHQTVTRPSTPPTTGESKGGGGGGVKSDVTDDRVRDIKAGALLSGSRGKSKSLVQTLRGITAASREGEHMLVSSHARRRLGEVKEEGRGGREREWGMGNAASSLTSESVRAKLETDPVIGSLQATMEQAVARLRDEVAEVCSQYSWLGQVHSHIQQWRREKGAKMSAEKLEAVLSELNQSLDRVSHLPPYLSTSHSLITINMEGVATSILPQLRSTMTRLQSAVASEARDRATWLLREARQHTQSLSTKRHDLEGFVEYANVLKVCQTFHRQQVASKHWVAGIHATLMRYQIQPTKEDKVMVQEMQRAWQQFEVCLQEGETFVKTESPIKAQGLQENISSLEEQLQQLAAEANGGDYVDPKSTPHHLLSRLEGIHRDMSDIRSEVMGRSKWKEAITSQHHDLSQVFHCFELFYARQELWKYRRQFDGCDSDWSSKSFRKLDMDYVGQKVTEWKAVCERLARTLPPDDPVLTDWRENVDRMYNNLPILQLLASKALQTAHWNTIFAAFGETYDSRQQYTLRGFLMRGLHQYRDIIQEICHEATQQSRLRAEITEMERVWQTKIIDLQQTPLDHYPFSKPREKKNRQKTISFKFPDTQPKPSSQKQEKKLFSVREGDSLMEEVSEASLRLTLLHSSPHLGALKGRVGSLRSSLSQLVEILSLLMQCQEQWQDLLELFLPMDADSRSSSGLEDLQEATAQFQEVTQSIHGDPRIFSLLSKSRGQKGYRELQGAFLRQTLDRIMEKMERVMVRLEPRIEEALTQCPRLGYLSRREILKAMSCRGDVMPILQLISRVFPSVSTLRFVETSDELSTRYQVTAVEGDMQEQLPLVVPLPLDRYLPVEWLRALEAAITFSLASKLTDCLQEVPGALLGQPLAAHKEAVGVWLRTHVLQNVLLALEVKWTDVLRAASSQPGGLEGACSQLQAAVEYAVEVLLSHMSRDLEGKRRKEEEEEEQVREVTGADLTTHKLRSVIVCLRHKLDFALSLLSGCGQEDMWTGHIHYTAESDAVRKEPEGAGQAEDEREGKRDQLPDISNRLRRSLTAPRSSLTTPRANLTGSRSSLTGSRANLTGSRSSLTGSRASLTTPKALLAPLKLRNSLTPLEHHSPTSLSSRASSMTASRVSLAASLAEQLHISKQTACLVHCGGLVSAYGFEYSGPTPMVVLTPSMESSLVSVATAIGNHCFPGITGDAGSSKTETTREVAKLLGRHYYHFICTPLTSAPTLLSLLSTALKCGSVLALGSPDSLPTLTLLKLNQYLLSLQSVLAGAFRDRPPSSATQQSQLSECVLSLSSPVATPTLTPHSSHHTLLPSQVTSSRLNWYTPSTHDTLLVHQETVQYMGETISASAFFSCCVVFGSGQPDCSSALQEALRVVTLEPPDWQLTVEVLLQSCGFADTFHLSRKLTAAIGHLDLQLPLSQGRRGLHLPSLRRVLSHAIHSLSTVSDPEAPSAQREALVRGLLSVYEPQVWPDSVAEVRDILDSHFPGSYYRVLEDRGERELTAAVEEEMRERHQKSTPEIVEKIMQLHHSLQRYRCTILTGRRDSGRTTCYRTLAAAYQRMGHLPVDITTINPAAYSWEQLFGCYEEVSGSLQWTNGIITRILSHISAAEHYHRAQAHPDKTGSRSLRLPPHWIVLDGPLSPSVMDTISALLSDGGLCLGRVEKVSLPSSCRLLLKPTGVSSLDPALVGRSGFLHWSADLVTTDLLVESWLDRAPTQHDLSAMSISYLGRALETLIPESIAFLDRVGSKCYGALFTAQSQLRVPGVAETLCLLSLLSAVLERNCPTRESTLGYSTISRASSRRSSLSSVFSFTRSLAGSRVGSALSRSSSQVKMPDWLPDSDSASDRAPSGLGLPLAMSTISLAQLQVLSILSFSFIWSIGAFVPFSEISSFDEFAREQIQEMPFSVSLPDEGSVFDYYLDLKTYQFQPWSMRKTKGNRVDGFVTTSELSRVSYIVDLYLSYNYNVMLVGEQGTGKTAFVERLLHSNMPLTSLPISQSLTAEQLQWSIIEKVMEVTTREEQRWRTRKHGSERCLFFLDDLHLSCHGGPLEHQLSSDCNPPPSVIETVLFVATHHTLHDFPRDCHYRTDNVRYIASCRPGQQFKALSHLLGTFHPVPFFPPSDESLHQIFSTNLDLWFKQYPQAAIAEPDLLSQAMSAASVAVYRSVSARLKPSPTTPHYILSVQHLMSVYAGLLLMPLDAKLQAQPQFSLLNRRGLPTSDYRERTSKKSARRSLSPTKGSRGGQRGSLPSVKRRESSMQAKLKSEAKEKAKEKVKDSSEERATLHRLVRLWCHENTRVYADRIAESRERTWFVKLLEACVKYCFCGIDFDKPVGSSTSVLPSVGGTAVQAGGRRGRGVRGRANVPVRSDELSFSELKSSGVRVDVLQKLLRREDESGPNQLIPFDQVLVRGEDVTGLIFCQLPAVQQTEKTGSSSQVDSEEEDEEEEEEGSGDTQPVQASPYTELGDGQVMEALTHHLQHYSAQEQESLTPVPDLVLFRRAMEHITRLCRVLVIPGCHALLLGVRGSGRKSLSRFVAHMMNAKLFELSEDSDPGSVHDQLKHVCMSAGVDKRRTVLLVSCSGTCRNTALWNSVSQVMSKGLCDGLFNSSHLLVISSKVVKGHMKRTPKLASQALASSVLSHLHVLVVWDTDRRTGSPFSTDYKMTLNQPGSSPSDEEKEEVTRSVFALLCQVCWVVDHYQPWQQQDISDIALRWWQERGTGSWQHWISSSSQLEALCNLVAHVHLTTLAVLDLSRPQLTAHLVSPKTFIECLKMTENIGSHLRAEEKERDDKLCSAVQRLAEVERAGEEMRQELESLNRQLQAVKQQLRQQTSVIEACQERYKAASQRCKGAKETIEAETQNVEKLRVAVREGLDKVAPLYNSALEALSAMNKTDLTEMMSYREPPTALIPVFNALCLLFDRPQTWEECKRLLLTPNFFQSLVFFDKEHISRHKLHQLQHMLRSKVWKTEAVEHGSHAVVSLSMWVAALLDYHRATAVVQPLRDKLVRAEQLLAKAEKTSVAMQKDMLETKSEFRAAQKQLSVSQQRKADIEANISNVNQRLKEANDLLSQTSSWKKGWEKERKAIQARIKSSPSHALLSVASVCYLGSVPPRCHKELQQNWVSYCAGNVELGSLSVKTSHHDYHSQRLVLQVQEDFSVKEVLSSKVERSYWEQEATFPCDITQERCLAARACLHQSSSQWPLVFDPLQLFCHYANALEISRTNQCVNDSSISSQLSGSTSQGAGSVAVLRVSAAGWVQGLYDCVETGQTAMLVLDQRPSEEDRSSLQPLLQRSVLMDPTLQDHLELDVPVDPGFRLYLVLEEYVREAPSAMLQSLGLQLLDFFVVDMELSTEALETHLRSHALQLERPEYSVRHRSLLADLALHKKQVESCQERVLEAVWQSQALLESPGIVQTVVESEEEQRIAKEHIEDTESALSRFLVLDKAYCPFAQCASLVFLTAQQLSRAFHYSSLSLQHFKKLIAALIAKHHFTRAPDSPAACHAHLLHLQREMLSDIHRHMKPSMFLQHHILLPLFVSLRQPQREDVVSEADLHLLGEDSGAMETQLMGLSVQQTLCSKPSWMPHLCWSELCLLQQSPVFQGLTAAVAGRSEEWREYAGLEVSLLSPAPDTGAAITHYHKMLLWKALRPNKFSEVVEEFVLLEMGSEFTPQWQQPNLDPVLASTASSSPVACVISEQGDWDAAGFLQAAAATRGVPFLRVDVLDRRSCEEALSRVEGWVTQGQWVVVDHAYLLDDACQLLQEFGKRLQECDTAAQSPQFRLWVTLLLPQLPAVGPDWHSVVLEGCGRVDPEQASQQLLAGVRLLMRSERTTPNFEWGSHQSLLVSLQQLLPHPLPEEQLRNLSPTEQYSSEQSQRTTAFLSQELREINNSLTALHASLQWVWEGTTDPLQFSSPAAATLKEMSENRIPRQWRDVLPAHLSSLPSLLPALRLLQVSLRMATEALQSGRLPRRLHPLWVSRLRHLLSRVQQEFAEEHQIPAEEVTLQGKVETTAMAHSENSSITFHGLVLCGASWDEARSTLTPSSTSTRVSVTVTPTMRGPELYHCPLYSTESGEHMLCHIPLPTSSTRLQASLHCLLDDSAF